MAKHPLANKRILITRAENQITETASLIKNHGGIAIPFPCLQQHILEDNIAKAYKHLGHVSDVLFTSVNGIQAVFAKHSDSMFKLLQDKRIAAVGLKTASALKQYDLEAHIIAKIASQQGLIEAYQHHGLPKSLLFFRAEDGNDAVCDYLQNKGVDVHLIKAYRSICPQADSTDVITMLKNNRMDGVMLGSSKTAEHYLQRIGDINLANRAALVAISQQVADAADKLGLKVQRIAKQPNFPSMLDSLADYFSERSL